MDEAPTECWGKTVESLLYHTYEMKRRASCGKSALSSLGEVFGGMKNMMCEYALILAAVHHTLKWDHLILTIDVMYGGDEDPKSSFELTEHLSVFSRCSVEKADMAIDSYRLCRNSSSVFQSRPKKVLDGWYKMSMDVLDQEFKERGWIS